MDNFKSDKVGHNFELEAVVSFDDRGQLVLPKELRKKYNLKAGEKFALISCTDKDGLCCLNLIKTKSLNTQIAKTISPILGGGCC